MDWLEILLIILIILFVGGYVAWRVVKAVRSKRGKSTRSACGGGCSCCAASGSCPHANGAAAQSDDDVMPAIEVQSEVSCDFSDLVEDAKKRSDGKD